VKVVVVVRWVCRCGVSRTTEPGMRNHLEMVHRVKLEEALERGLCVAVEETTAVDPMKQMRIIATANRIIKLLEKDTDVRRKIAEYLATSHMDEIKALLE